MTRQEVSAAMRRTGIYLPRIEDSALRFTSVDWSLVGDNQRVMSTLDPWLARYDTDLRQIDRCRVALLANTSIRLDYRYRKLPRVLLINTLM